MYGRRILGMRACTWVYLVLIAFTFITFLVAKAGLSGLEISLFVLFLAVIKGQLIGAYFMGLRSIQGPWHWPVFVWLWIPAILIGTAFYLATQQ